MRVLAIGAFERDNFGDLLFLKILRDFMKNKDVSIIPASIIFSDMRKVNGEVVYPYELMLSLYKWDAVWIVGGEVGGVDMESAILMDAMTGQGQHYIALDEFNKDKYNTLLKIPKNENCSAYLPDIRKYHKNRNTPMIINSVGVSNSPLGTKMSDNEINVLSQAFVSVRDSKSAEFCRSKDIEYKLSPDVVSAIAHFHPITAKTRQENYIVLQINNDLLHKTALSKFATDLKDVSERLDSNIILLSAGVTFGHDNSNLYEKLIEQYKTLNSKHAMRQYKERDPILITELIAGAKLCIATSLHCRIVSESYGVSHISLSNNKVTNYGSTWKDYDPYPYNVKPSLLKDTILELQERKNKITERGALGKKAIKNLEELYSQVKKIAVSEDESVDEKDIFIEYASGQKDTLDVVFTNILSERERHEVQVQRLNQQIHLLDQEVSARGDGINSITRSKSYRLGLAVTAPYRMLWRLVYHIVHYMKKADMPSNRN